MDTAQAVADDLGLGDVRNNEIRMKSLFNRMRNSARKDGIVFEELDAVKLKKANALQPTISSYSLRSKKDKS